MLRNFIVLINYSVLDLVCLRTFLFGYVIQQTCKILQRLIGDVSNISNAYSSFTDITFLRSTSYIHRNICIYHQDCVVFY